MPLATDGQSPIPGSLSTPTINQRARSLMDDASIDVSDDSMRSEDVDGSESGTNGLSTKKPRISHACQACRRMKIRCEPLEYQDSCKQCSKTNRACLITTTRRKRQKTVHRIAELEEKLKTLTAAVGSRANQHHVKESKKSNSNPEFRTQNSPSVLDLNASIAESIASPASWVMRSAQRNNKAKYIDVIDSGMIDKATAYKVFYRFCTEMAGFFPFVVFPEQTTAQEIRSRRPITFLSILAAGICVFKPGLLPDLSDELTFTLADRIIYRGERSFDLLQALLVLAAFYSKPKHQKELNFNQTKHIAAMMALDLGIGRRLKKGVFVEKSPFPDVSVFEIRRTWLGCYYSCAK
jgi:hypothetical protein